MGLFSNQLSNVVEWDESREGVIFWKWPNDEIKKGSKLFIRPGQDAIFMYNGKIEGVFEDDGSYDIETQIIPFLLFFKFIYYIKKVHKSLYIRNGYRIINYYIK